MYANNGCAGNIKIVPCCLSTLLSFKSISGSIFQLEFGNKNADRHTHDQTDGLAHDQTVGQTPISKTGFKSIVESIFKLESRGRIHERS